MHERKARFTDLSDGFVTIPGGVGTMDELWEAISWSQLGYHSEAGGGVECSGVFRPTGCVQSDHMIDVGFIRAAA